MKNKTVKELLVIAKELNIRGRHKMRKQKLIEQIEFEQELAKQVDDVNEEWQDEIVCSIEKQPEKTEPPKKAKLDYIDNVKVGQLVAFKVGEEKALSGKIIEIHSSQFVVETKNGIKFNVLKENIIWVKTTDRWPKGVYLALKGEGPVNAEHRKFG